MRGHEMDMNVLASAAATLCGLGSMLAAVPDSKVLLRTFAWDTREVPADYSHVGLKSALAAGGNVVGLDSTCEASAGNSLLLVCGGVALCFASFISHFMRGRLCHDAPARQQAAIGAASCSSMLFAAAAAVFSNSCVVEGSTIGFGRLMVLAAAAIQLVVTYVHVRTPVAVSAVLPLLSEGIMRPKFAPPHPSFPARCTVRRRVEESEFVEADPKPVEADPEPVEPEFSARSLPGAIPPFGFFDPLGLSEVPLGRSYSAEARLKYFREAELKHGRVAMLAALGFLVGEQFHPLFGGNIDVPSYVAFQQTPLQAFWPAVVAVIGAIEVSAIKKYKSPIEATWSLREDAVPGDFGFDPLGLKPGTEQDLMAMQNKELSNGRLAMLAIAGMVGQELANGQKLFGGAAPDTVALDSVDPAKVAEIAKEMADVLNSTQ